MFLIEMIVVLIIVSISSLKITMRRKTGDDKWGEPMVTILQIIGIIVLLFLLTAERTMMSGS